MQKTYRVQTDNGLMVAVVRAGSFNDALAATAREKGYASWSAYRTACRIERVEFDGNFRIILK